jgi:hypothetical protein
MNLALEGRDRAEAGLWGQAVTRFNAAMQLSGDSPVLRRQISHWCRKFSETLLGQKLELAGSTVEGASFDLSTYRQKTVLIGFWEASSAHGRQQWLKVRTNYGLYRDRGFDVVVITTDSKGPAFPLDGHEGSVSWPVLPADGIESLHPALRWVALSNEPAAILVDAEGRLVSTCAQGEELDRLLEQCLGPTWVPEGGTRHEDDQQPDRFQLNGQRASS